MFPVIFTHSIIEVQLFIHALLYLDIPLYADSCGLMYSDLWFTYITDYALQQSN